MPLCDTGANAPQEVKRKPIVDNFSELKRILNLLWEDTNEFGKMLTPIMTTCATAEELNKKLNQVGEDSEFARELKEATMLACSIKDMIKDYKNRIEI